MLIVSRTQLLRLLDIVLADDEYANSNRRSFVFVSNMEGKNNTGDLASCLFQPEHWECRTLNFVLTTIIMQEMIWIDTIIVNDFGDREKTIQLPDITTAPRIINITCVEYCVYFYFNLSVFAKAFQGQVAIQIEGFWFEHSMISVGNVYMVLKNIHFVDSVVTDWTDTNQHFGEIELHFINTTFESRHLQQNSTQGLVIDKVFVAGIHVLESKFTNASTLILVQNTYLDVQDTYFVESEIVIDSDMLSVTRFQNVSFAGLKCSFSGVSIVKITGIKLRAQFISCVFENSSGIALEKKDSGLLDSWFEISIKFCIYQSNKKAGSGGAISVLSLTSNKKLSNQQSFLNITNCSFSLNEAVNFGSLVSQGGAVSIVNKGALQRCGMLSVEIKNCLFTDNKATDSGGAIFTSGKCLGVLVHNSSFKITDKFFDSPKGVFIFSLSDILINMSVFSREIKENTPSLLELKMLSNIVNIDSFWFSVQCHPWQKLCVETEFIQNQLGESEIACSSCSSSFYIPSDGLYVVSLLPNQTEVSVESTTTKSGILDCIPCPPGADCPGNNIIAKPNFWGEQSGSGIMMHQCPAQYCCTANCTGYSKCSGHRTGELCGRCEEDYSLSFFSSQCYKDNSCNETWLWLFVILAIVFYMFWYTFKNEVFGFLTMTVEKMCRCCATNSDNSEASHSDARYLKRYFGIVTYFMQVKSVMMSSITEDTSRAIDSIFLEIESYIQLVLSFDFTQISNTSCAVHGITTTRKTIFKFLFLLGVYVSWVLVFISMRVSEHIFIAKKMKAEIFNNVRMKLISGFVEIIKYTYSGFSSIVFYSLVCVSIAGNQIWFYDGSIKCYSEWQAAMFMFCIFCTIPYPFVVFVGMKLLRRKTISSKSFFAATCLPLPSLAYWFILVFIQQKLKGPDSREQEGTTQKKGVEDTIYEGFKGGYRESASGTQYWEAIVMLRRLLISGTILIPDALIQLSICLALCIVFLLHHAYNKPFRHNIANHAESFSLTLLCGVAGINLIKAAFLFADVNLHGPQVQLVKNLELIEVMSVVFLIVFIVVLEVVSAVVQRTQRVVVTPSH